MTQLTEEHFEVHSTNKDRMYKEQKIKFLEDKIKVLEKSVERLNKLMGDIMGVKE
tara:strand:+ start:276 stop:440 length:165 start_codon:yes stop_codon:yes gene_type:complete